MILNGVDLRSELKQVNMTPEYIMSITNGWGKHYIDNYHNRTNMDNKGYHEEQLYSLDTEWYIKVVIILMSFFALLYFFAMIFRRTKGCRGMRRLLD
ncbi:hypothetical protein [Candidatus Ichthyocystis hellenicum]|uniref:hypothetical protein n=1 Tax=Candidatus Ichthyocystis hellenicum TaxID=1561003 RepID=UPI0012FDD076|nr:hypothetical protein [Candidatus Ichthyocystis hellenicum]